MAEPRRASRAPLALGAAALGAAALCGAYLRSGAPAPRTSLTNMAALAAGGCQHAEDASALEAQLTSSCRGWHVAKANDEDSSDVTFAWSNEYEREAGRPVAEGYPLKNVIEIHRPTVFEAVVGGVAGSATGDAYEWVLTNPDGEATTHAGAAPELTLTKTGRHTLEGRATSADPARRLQNGKAFKIDLLSKFTRRSIYDLKQRDREQFLSAMRIMYSTEGELGRKQFGKKYLSMEELVATHLEGAADKACDHWHDDAGFVVHHIAFTLLMEQSLQAIDETITVPYWDYTLDELLDDWTQAQMFQEDWFGQASPETESHVISNGPWAFTPVKKKAEPSTSVHNPYGLLRSPWNTNPTPYVTRYRYTVGMKDAGYTLPSCKHFRHAYNSMTIALINNYLNGILHGQIHIMLGGHWNVYPNATLGMGAQEFLLSSKFLWRQGYVRCPAYCSLDTPDADCTCECPASILEEYGGYAGVYETSGLDVFNSMFIDDWLGTANGDLETVMKAICSVGHPGEMFTSAAPYDPTFWPLHGLADRFVALKRKEYYAMDTYLDETWGYDHAVSNVASDTKVVCDWSNVQSDLDMPVCSKGTCPGHREDDLLPFGNFLGNNETYTNYEFYEFMSPSNDDYPYVYDSLIHWPACDDAGEDITGASSDNSAGYDDEINMQDDDERR